MKKELYLGLDVHKDCMATVVAEEGRTGEVRDPGESAMICTRWRNGLRDCVKRMARKRYCGLATKRGRAVLEWRGDCGNWEWSAR